MLKLFAALAVLAALILFTPPPASAAARTDGARNLDQYEFSAQRRYHRRYVRARHVYRPWRAHWGPRLGWRRAYWGPAYGFYRPWRPYYRPWGWGYRPWSWAGYRPWGWGYRPWGRGYRSWAYRPGVTVSFGFGRPYGGWWW
jgi:hypothetical protein